MKVSILGGGLTGLSAAHFLLKHRSASKISEVVIYEAADRLGGWIDTTRHEDGIVYEHGPRTVRATGNPGAATLELIEELGLAPKLKVVRRGHPSTVNRLVYVDGELHRLPYSWTGLFKKMQPFRKPLIFAGLRELFAPRKVCSDESLFDFVSRRLGEDVAQYAADPMVRGICAGDAKEISADAFVAGPAFRREQLDGGVMRSVLKGMIGLSKYEAASVHDSDSELVKESRRAAWAVWSLEGGLSTLVESLRDDLTAKGVKILTKSPANSLTLSPPMNVSVNDDRTGHVLASLPAFSTAKLLTSNHAKLRDLLMTIPYVTVAVVNVEYAGKIDLDCGDGFGLLVPSNQTNTKVLGITFDTCIFKQRDRTVFTVMLGGKWFHSVFGPNPCQEHLRDVAVSEISKILNINSDPHRVVCKIQRDCIAQYTVGHNTRLKEMRDHMKANGMPLSLLGNAFDGIGINLAVTSARDQVNQLFA